MMESAGLDCVLFANVHVNTVHLLQNDAAMMNNHHKSVDCTNSTHGEVTQVVVM
jgi:hypothetical protein